MKQLILQLMLPIHSTASPQNNHINLTLLPSKTQNTQGRGTLQNSST